MLSLRKQKGFTLVELILVILIIGILAGVVIPRISYTTGAAELSAANANVSRVNATLEYAVVADGMTYPTTNAIFTTWLEDTDYFPEGVTIPGAHTMSYNTGINRAQLD